MSQERRESIRMPIQLQVRQPSGDWGPLHEGDLSIGGACVKQPDPFRFDAFLDLAFVLPGEEMSRSVHCHVLRYIVDRGELAAVMTFERIELEDELAIARAVDEFTGIPA